MEQNRNGVQAGITVFLSMTLLIILALVGTMAEVTRGTVCEGYSTRTLSAAGYSLLTEYSRPLYEQYDLFFLEDAGKSFEQSIAEYAADILQPDTIPGRNMDLYAGMLTDVRADEKKYAGDDGCEAMIGQICACMKRQLAVDALKKFTGSTEKAARLEQSAGEIEQRAAEEQKAAKQNQSLISLMKCIDGVSWSGGKISGSKYFVKMFCFGKKEPEHFAVTEASVWKAIKKNVINIEEKLNDIAMDPKGRNELLTCVREADKQLKKAEKILLDLGDGAEAAGVSPGAAEVLSSNHRILVQVKTILEKQTLSEEEVDRLRNLWRAYDAKGIVFDYTGIGSQGGAENPLKTFQNAVAKGISRLVVKDGQALSSKSVTNNDHYKEFYEGKEEENDYRESVQNFAKKKEIRLQTAVRDIAQISETNFMLARYIDKKFSSVKKSAGGTAAEKNSDTATKKNSDTATKKKRGRKKKLEYEWEYIVCGEASDRENLEQVLNRIVLLRTVTNSGVLFASASKRETAYAAALAVVGFTGLEPLIRFTQTIFTVLWGMAESVVDVAALLQNKSVPFIKTEKDWKVDFSDLFQFGKPYIMEKAGTYSGAGKADFGYEQYLMLFLTANGSDVTCYRMMDLMEWNIRENDFKGFHFGICVDSFRVTGNFSFRAKFFQFPFIRQMLDRKLERYNRETYVRLGY